MQFNISIFSVAYSIRIDIDEGNCMTLNKRITLLFPLSLILYELPLYLSNNLFLPALPEVTKSFKVTNATAQLSIAF